MRTKATISRKENYFQGMYYVPTPALRPPWAQIPRDRYKYRRRDIENVLLTLIIGSRGRISFHRFNGAASVVLWIATK